MMKDLFKGLQIGKVENCGISQYGIAIKTDDGDILSYDKINDEIVSVELLSMMGGNYIYAFPIALDQVNIGDIILHKNDTPVFVKEIITKGKKINSFKVVDIKNKEEKKVLPAKSPFGFSYVTKYVSMLGDFMMGNNASEQNPFGTLSPMMIAQLFNDDDNDDNSMSEIMVLSSLFSGNGMNNMNSTLSTILPLITLLETKGGSDGNINFMKIMMSVSMMMSQQIMKQNQSELVQPAVPTKQTPKRKVTTVKKMDAPKTVENKKSIN